MSDIRISIIIPAYNEERYLAACLDSVAAQTVKPYEVIVVDNNSTDNTAKIAERYPFVKLLHEPRQGIVHARNVGFDHAKGDILARTDADARLPRDWLESVQHFYGYPEHASMGLTGHGRPHNLPFSKALGWLQAWIAIRVNRLLLGHYIFFGSNMAIPRPTWSAVRKELCLRTDIHEDLDLAIHTHRSGYEIAYREWLEVTIRAARVVSNRKELLGNLMMWPRTLKLHHIRTWVFGWLGAMLLYLLSFPLFVVAKLAGSKA